MQEAKSQFEIGHDCVNDACEVRASGGMPVRVRAGAPDEKVLVSNYLEALRDLSALFPAQDAAESAQGRRGGADREGGGTEPLTPRECEVLILIANGKSSRGVAQILGIAFKTVVVHRQRIYAKLQVHKTTDLMRVAIRMGLTKV